MIFQNKYIENIILPTINVFQSLPMKTTITFHSLQSKQTLCRRALIYIYYTYNHLILQSHKCPFNISFLLLLYHFIMVLVYLTIHALCVLIQTSLVFIW